MAATRYDQCDETCTVDCGHCKGEGAPTWEQACERWRAVAQTWEDLYRQSADTNARWRRTFDLMCLNVVLMFVVGLILGGAFK